MAEQIPGGQVAIRWGLTTHTWGLFANVYRGAAPDFELRAGNRVARTELGSFVDDADLPAGVHHYAVVFDNARERSQPARVSVTVR